MKPVSVCVVLTAHKMVTTMCHEKFVWNKFEGHQRVESSRCLYANLHAGNTRETLENAKSRDSEVIPMGDSVQFRAGCTKSHAISSTEARERAISRFHGAPGGVLLQVLT